MIYLQIVLATLLLPLVAGPLSLYLTHGGPNLIIIVLWAFIWFTNKNNSIRFAVILGLMLDLISFNFFGYWLLQLVLLVILVDFLKSKYFDSASLLHALLGLVLMIIVNAGFTLLVSGQANGLLLITNILSSAILGAIVYYLLAVRLKLFARWVGQRI